ncbi:MAG: TolC family protein [Saprospiraceae bacterium]|nr:TolC family protein [Saprospiraceae bacterium]
MKTIIATALAGAIFVQCYGQSPEIRTLSLDEVVTLGMANSKQIQVSAARTEAAGARTRQARSSTVPTLSYTGSYYRLSDNIEPFETSFFTVPVLLNQVNNRLSISEPVFTGLRALNTIRATEFLEKAARYDLEKDKKEIQINLLTAAINLYKLQEARKVFERSLATAQNRLTDTRNLNRQGIALDNDLLKADLSVTQIETARIETDNAIAAAQYALNTLLGLPPTTLLQIDSTSILERATPAPLETFLTGSTQRADYMAATQRAFASEKQVSVGKGAYLPLVTLGANLYANNPNQRQFPIEDKLITTWDAGVGVSWNLSSLMTNKFAVQEAKLNLIQANAVREQISENARSEIASNYYAWQTATQKIALYEKSVAQAAENQRITKLRSDQQISSLTDLLDADSLFVQAQINRVSILADARLAYLKLLRSAARL